MAVKYAHSLAERPQSAWEPLSRHLAAVGGRAAGFADVFGCAAAAGLAGLLHDIGKASDDFQGYISTPREDLATGRKGPDHSTAGAREACRAYPGLMGRLLAYAIAGHHAGLANADELDRRLDPRQTIIKRYDDWADHTGPLPQGAAVAPRHLIVGPQKGFTEAFLGRMLFSCLVDADFLETEAFYAEAEERTVERGGHAGLETLRGRLREHMEVVAAKAGSSPTNKLRAEVLGHAVGKAGLPPGLFTLTVPTGGGKTLASLSFALEHAAQHGMRRVIYVIPYTSIIEQTASVFRDALKTEDDVLEHHANFDWEGPVRTGADDVAKADDEGPEGMRKLRRAAENWDAPVVVTTAVQFFESLFAARTSRCRKLHNIAGAVIVLDEAQTLPLHLLRPCMAALDELCRNYRASVVLCTATQPALREKDGFKGGFTINDDRELAPDPKRLYTALKRVTVEVSPEPVADADIAARFAQKPQMLCILNSRAHSRALFDAIRDQPGAVHLSTLMIPRHRRRVLEEVRRCLKDGAPVRLVATSLIEAGVDVDFPEVWRAAAGLDSIAQAAGRCNREGLLEMGRTVVFTPADAKPPRALKAFWQATEPVLRKHEDLLGLDAVNDYFGELYWQKGEAALDAALVDGRPGVLAAIREQSRAFSFPFRSIAETFHLIDEVMEPVVVPWKADDEDRDAEQLLARIAAMDRPRTADLRRMQQYTVSIPRKARDTWLARGALRPVHPRLGDALLRFDDLAHYRLATGVDVDALDLRAAETNIIN